MVVKRNKSIKKSYKNFRLRKGKSLRLNKKVRKNYKKSQSKSKSKYSRKNFKGLKNRSRRVRKSKKALMRGGAERSSLTHEELEIKDVLSPDNLIKLFLNLENVKNIKSNLTQISRKQIETDNQTMCVYVVKLQNNSLHYINITKTFGEFKKELYPVGINNNLVYYRSPLTGEIIPEDTYSIVYVEGFDASTFYRKLLSIVNYEESTAPEKLIAALNEMPSHVSGHPIYILKNYNLQ